MQNEMTAVLSQSTVGADEAELDAELTAMADAVLQEQMADLPTAPKVRCPAMALSFCPFLYVSVSPRLTLSVT